MRGAPLGAARRLPYPPGMARKQRIDPADPRVGGQRMSRELGVLKVRRRAETPPSAPEGVRLAAVRVVLVRTEHAANVGASARAMLNCGLSRLLLVDPRCSWRSSDARRPAVGAWEVVKHATEHPDLDSALAGCGLSVALTSARGREQLRPMPMPEVLPRLVAASRTRDVALVLGSEADGLTSDEIARCDVAASLVVSPAFASLNLAQAVLLAAHAVFVAGREVPAAPHDPPPLDEDREAFHRALVRVLDRVGFVSKQNPRRFDRTLRGLFGRVALADWELRLLRGIVSQIEDRLDHPERVRPARDDAQRDGANEGPP